MTALISVVVMGTIYAMFYIALVSNVSRFATVFDTFNMKLTQMDTVEGGMLPNLRPARTMYQKIITKWEPGIFREGNRKTRFSTRIERCLEADELGHVSIRLLERTCINVTEVAFFFLSILTFLLCLMLLWKLFSWLNTAVTDQNVPLSAVWENILKNRMNLR